MPFAVLIRPSYDSRNRSAPAFPWAYLYLAAVLRERGVEVEILDEMVMPDLEARLERALEKRPAAVGITAMTGEQIRHGLRWSKCVRERGGAAIVWGGIHASLMPEQTARHALVDYAVAGEGEFAFADLVACLAKNGDPSGIPGVFFARGGEIIGVRPKSFVDLANLPEFPFDLVDIERYITRRPDLGIERHFEICTSRGCPHHCGFCYIESVHGSRWRSLEAAECVARIKEAVRRFGVDGVSFREDNFFVRRARVEAIARALMDEKINIKWTASCRINYAARYTPKFLALLRESGCALLTFGVESGSDRVLEWIQKDITTLQVLEVAEKMSESGIRATYHFMGGFPAETTEEFLETCRLIDTLRVIAPDSVVREMSVFAPYPGIGLIPACVERGYREPQTLEEWVAMDWGHPERPWLTGEQSRLIADAQFLIARLAHPNAAVRAWAQWRWRQLVNSRAGIRLLERPWMERARNAARRGRVRD